MAADTTISWCDDTSSPWWGCAKVSPACANCYAEGLARRFHRGTWGPAGVRALRVDACLADLARFARRGLREGRWRRVFLGSMCDVFEDRVDLVEPRKRLWDGMHRLRPGAHVMVLTKRAEEMAAWAREFGWPAVCWAGVTVEDHQRAGERIPHLLRVPAVVRFLSCEPLLGPLDIGPLWPRCWSWPADRTLTEAKVDGSARRRPQALVAPGFKRIDWVISGGESGPHARPSHPDWFRSLRDQCVEAGVAYHHKQNGEWAPVGRAGSWSDFEDIPGKAHVWIRPDGQIGPGEGVHRMVRVGKSTAGRLLDGREWNEFPEVTRA